MRLLTTLTSPYGRIVRMQLAQCALDGRVTVDDVPTRVPDSPVLAFNPTGKVPTLVLDDGTVLAETRLICEFLDTLHDAAPFAPPPADLAARALEGLAVGFLDGVAVWIRELRRPVEERSPGILAQEQARAERVLAHLQGQPALLAPADHYAMCCVAVALWRLDYSVSGLDWKSAHPAVAAWYAGVEQSQPFMATTPD